MPPEPRVVTVTLPDASIVVRSPTFNTAFVAVGLHTPPEQFMFCVSWEEIVTAAFAGAQAARAANVTNVARLQIICPTLQNSTADSTRWGNETANQRRTIGTSADSAWSCVAMPDWTGLSRGFVRA